MPARVLDGTSADIQRAPGALSGMQYGTVGITLKRGATGGPHDYFVAHNSAGTAQWALYFDTGDAASWWTTSGSGGPTLSSTTAWLTIITRKASGSSTPRWSVYNHTTAAWTHTAGNAAIAEGTAPGASGTYRFSWEGTEFFNGNAAVGAAWSNRLPWSADAAGDTAIEASGLPWALRHWVTAQPDALWVFDQQIIEQPVLDRTGKGAHQSTRTGTTVTWDTPPGLDLRSPETVRVKATASGLTPVGKDLALQWDVRAAVGDPVQAIWDVRQAIGDPVALQWDVRAAVGDTAQLIWDTRAAIGDDVQLIWDVASALTAVGKALDLRWALRVPIGDSVQLVWDVASNLVIATPPERTYTIPAEVRTYLVPFDTRAFTVPAETRTVEVV